MSEDMSDFDDSFEINETICENKDIFDKLFANDFEDEIILLELSSNEELPQIVLNFDNYCNRSKSNDLYFDYVFGLTKLIQKLTQIEDQIIDLWLKSPKQTQNSILSTIFRLLPNCCLELCLPKIVDLFQFDHNLRISFYELICFTICQLITTLTESQYHFVEQTLFENLLSEQLVCHQLASDLLCFTARLGTQSPLCYQYCSVLMSISTHIDDTYLPNTTSLLNRLMPFLKPLELNFLLKDYHLLTHSRIWRLLNISRILSKTQITETFDKIRELIDNGNSLNKYNINILCDLFRTDEFEAKTRENIFALISKNFLTLNQTKLYSDFIDLLIVLLNNPINDSIILKLITKMNVIFKQNKSNSDSVLIEKTLTFLVRISCIQFSVSFENRISKTMTQLIETIYTNNTNFYDKYLILIAMKNISFKSKHISIITDCFQDLKQEFICYLNKLKSIKRIDEIEKTVYLQNILLKLRIDCDLKTRQTVREESETNNGLFDESEDNRREIGFESEMNLSDKQIETQFESNIRPEVQEKLDLMEEFVEYLRQNQSIFDSEQVKQRFISVSKQFNDIVLKFK